MKKVFFLAAFLMFVFNFISSFAQTCDCEALQTEINEIKNLVTQLIDKNTNQFMNTNIDIEPTNYRKQVYIDKDYYISGIYDIIITDVSYQNHIQQTIEYTALKINFYFGNNTPFQTKYTDKVIIRAYQGENRLKLDGINTKRGSTVPARNSIEITESYILNNDTDDVTLEICEAVGFGGVGYVKQVATWVIPLSNAIRE